VLEREIQEVRPPAVAGSVYPADPAALGTLVDRLLDEEPARGRRPAAALAARGQPMR